jgi:hypothetical protein
MNSCSDAGNWLFCGRKWIDPADPDGRTKLELHHHNLSILFPAFTSACSLDCFIDAVTAVTDSWSRHTEAAAEGGRCSSVVDISPSHSATESNAASPSGAHRTARDSDCSLLAAGPDPDSGDHGGPGPDAWMGIEGVGTDVELRTLAFAADAT